MVCNRSLMIFLPSVPFRFKAQHFINVCLTVYVVGYFRVRLVERGAPQSLPLMESGKVGNVKCTPLL